MKFELAKLEATLSVSMVDYSVVTEDILLLMDQTDHSICGTIFLLMKVKGNCFVHQLSGT